MRHQRYETGLSGEQQAEEWLCGKGMRCLLRRYRAADGEIDLVMADGDAIAFIEVKYRPFSAPGTGLIAITPDKQRRMRNAALVCMVKNGWMDKQIRFDAVEITSGGIRHIPNAF